MESDSRVTKTTLKTPLLDMNRAEFFADPYPTYARLRASEGPTYSEAESTWLVTRYEDVEMVLKDPRFSKRLPERDAAKRLSRLWRSDHARIDDLLPRWSTDLRTQRRSRLDARFAR